MGRSSDEEEDGAGDPGSLAVAMCAVCLQPTPKARVHYGGISCYSCRAFFRRAVQKGEERACKREGNCYVTFKDRKQCASCRWKQCLKVGMKPHLVLTEDEKKVRFRKLLEKQKRPNQEETATNQETSAPSAWQQVRQEEDNDGFNDWDRAVRHEGETSPTVAEAEAKPQRSEGERFRWPLGDPFNKSGKVNMPPGRKDPFETSPPSHRRLPDSLKQEPTSRQSSPVQSHEVDHLGREARPFDPMIKEEDNDKGEMELSRLEPGRMDPTFGYLSQSAQREEATKQHLLDRLLETNKELALDSLRLDARLLKSQEAGPLKVRGPQNNFGARANQESEVLEGHLKQQDQLTALLTAGLQAERHQKLMGGHYLTVESRVQRGPSPHQEHQLRHPLALDMFEGIRRPEAQEPVQHNQRPLPPPPYIPRSPSSTVNSHNRRPNEDREHADSRTSRGKLVPGYAHHSVIQNSKSHPHLHLHQRARSAEMERGVPTELDPRQVAMRTSMPPDHLRRDSTDRSTDGMLQLARNAAAYPAAAGHWMSPEKNSMSPSISVHPADATPTSSPFGANRHGYHGESPLRQQHSPLSPMDGKHYVNQQYNQKRSPYSGSRRSPSASRSPSRGIPNVYAGGSSAASTISAAMAHHQQMMLAAAIAAPDDLQRHHQMVNRGYDGTSAQAAGHQFASGAAYEHTPPATHLPRQSPADHRFAAKLDQNPHATLMTAAGPAAVMTAGDPVAAGSRLDKAFNAEPAIVKRVGRPRTKRPYPEDGQQKILLPSQREGKRIQPEQLRRVENLAHATQRTVGGDSPIPAKRQCSSASPTRLGLPASPGKLLPDQPMVTSPLEAQVLHTRIHNSVQQLTEHRLDLKEKRLSIREKRLSSFNNSPQEHKALAEQEMLLFHEEEKVASELASLSAKAETIGLQPQSPLLGNILQKSKIKLEDSLQQESFGQFTGGIDHQRVGLFSCFFQEPRPLASGGADSLLSFSEDSYGSLLTRLEDIIDEDKQKEEESPHTSQSECRAYHLELSLDENAVSSLGSGTSSENSNSLSSFLESYFRQPTSSEADNATTGDVNFEVHGPSGSSAPVTTFSLKGLLNQSAVGEPSKFDGTNTTSRKEAKAKPSLKLKIRRSDKMSTSTRRAKDDDLSLILHHFSNHIKQKSRPELRKLVSRLSERVLSPPVADDSGVWYPPTNEKGGEQASNNQIQSALNTPVDLRNTLNRSGPGLFARPSATITSAQANRSQPTEDGSAVDFSVQPNPSVSRQSVLVSGSTGYGVQLPNFQEQEAVAALAPRDAEGVSVPQPTRCSVIRISDSQGHKPYEGDLGGGRLDLSTAVREEATEADEEHSEAANRLMPYQTSSALETAVAQQPAETQLDDNSLLEMVMSLNMQSLEEIYTREEQNYLDLHNTQFWNKWRDYNLGPDVLRTYIEWVQHGGELHPDFFTVGNRQLRQRLIAFVFEYDDLDRLKTDDYINLLRNNVKLGGMLFNVFNYGQSGGDSQQDFALGKDDHEQWKAARVNFVGLKDIFKAIPIAQKNKDSLIAILEKYKNFFHTDPKIFILTLGIVLYNTKGIPLKKQKEAEDIQMEYLTMLRRYLAVRGYHNGPETVKGLLECVNILPNMLEFFQACSSQEIVQSEIDGAGDAQDSKELESLVITELSKEDKDHRLSPGKFIELIKD